VRQPAVGNVATYTIELLDLPQLWAAANKKLGSSRAAFTGRRLNEPSRSSKERSLEGRRAEERIPSTTSIANQVNSSVGTFFGDADVRQAISNRLHSTAHVGTCAESRRDESLPSVFFITRHPRDSALNLP
jgi:hypothetical protein